MQQLPQRTHRTSQGSLLSLQHRLRKAAPKKKAAPEIHEEEEEEPVEIKKLAIPRYSPAQLAAKAKKEGDAPDIVKDEITKVTLFDYSDIFADEDEDEDEYYDDED